MLTLEEFKKWEFRDRIDQNGGRVFDFIVNLDKEVYRLSIDVTGDITKEDIIEDVYERAAKEEYMKWLDELNSNRDKLGHAQEMDTTIPLGNSNLAIFDK